MLVEVVANNNLLTEEKSLVEHTVITELPVPDKNTQQGKFARKYDKHQIQLSSVKKEAQNHPVKSHSGKIFTVFTKRNKTLILLSNSKN